MTAATHYLPRPASAAQQRLSPPLTYGRRVIALRLRDAIVRLVRRAAADRPGLRLVDFGCGAMPYRPLLEPLFASYLGIDLPGNSRADFRLLPGGRCDAPDACADVLLSTQVLEHVADVPACLRESARLLAPGGRLVLTTHGTWVHHPDPIDYWRWTSQGLRHVLESAGFRVLHAEGLLGLIPTGIQLLQDGLVRKLPRPLRPAACLTLQSAVSLADRLHSHADRARDACVYALLAELAPENAPEPAPENAPENAPETAP